MGKYIDLLENISIDNFEFNETLTTDIFTPAINSSTSFTNGWIGIGVLTPIWFGLFQHLSNKANLFEMSPLQAIISTNALIFSIAIVLVYIEVLTSSQHFVWVSSLLFIVNVIGVLRTT